MYDCNERTIVLNKQFNLTIVRWAKEGNRWKINGLILRTSKTYFLNNLKKTKEMGNSRMIDKLAKWKKLNTPISTRDS